MARVFFQKCAASRRNSAMNKARMKMKPKLKRPAPASGPKAIADNRQREQKPRIVKVTDRVWCTRGYSGGNALFVLTEKSIVAIDTTENISAARKCFDDLRKLTELPVSHIIYTNFQSGHVRGAKAFHTPNV